MSGLVWGLCGATVIGVSDCVARVTASRISLSVLIALIMTPPFAGMTIWFAVGDGWPVWHAWGLERLGRVRPAERRGAGAAFSARWCGGR